MTAQTKSKTPTPNPQRARAVEKHGKRGPREGAEKRGPHPSRRVPLKTWPRNAEVAGKAPKKTAHKKTTKRGKPAKKVKRAPRKKAAKRAGKRHTDKQRAALVAKYEGLLAAGEKTTAAAKKVGVGYITLLNWRKKFGSRKINKKSPRKTSRKQAPKRSAVAPAKTGGTVLVTPNGFRIEGLSPKDIIRVMREMG